MTGGESMNFEDNDLMGLGSTADSADGTRKENNEIKNDNVSANGNMPESVLVFAQSLFLVF